MDTIIGSINHALHDLEVLDNLLAPSGSILSALKGENVMQDLACSEMKCTFHKSMNRLKNLRSFLLCARKLGKSGDLGSLLEKVEAAVCRNANKILPWFYTVENFNILDQTVQFAKDIQCFDKEIDKWYMTLLEHLQPSSSSPTVDEVRKIIDSVLDNLAGYIRTANDPLVHAIGTLEGQIKILRNTICPTMLQNVEPRRLEILLALIEYFTLNAAHFSHMGQFYEDDEECMKGMVDRIRVLKVIFIMCGRLVYTTYNQVLTHLKCMSQLHTKAGYDVMKHFISFLACELWKMLQMDDSLVDSMRTQLQVMYEGLRFLKTIIKQQPRKFDEKIRNETAFAINNAGAILFSLPEKDEKTIFWFVEFIQSIRVIRAAVEEEVPKTSKRNFPRTNVLGFVDFLLENLMELKSCETDSNVQDHVQAIQAELDILRSFLAEIAEIHNQQEEVQYLWNRAVKVAYKVEFLIDHLVVGDIQDSFSKSLCSITKDIRNIKSAASKIMDGKRRDIKEKKLAGTSIHTPSQSVDPMFGEIVGFHKEAESIIQRLTRGSKQLRIVAIVGMPGQGKTTLATKVYNDPEVLYHFHLHAWCSIPKIHDKKKIMLELLSHVLGRVPESYLGTTEDDLADVVRRRLKGNRYLIFLDGVWDIQTWRSLEASLPDDSNGSRIIVTSRHCNVAPQAILDEEPLLLRQFTNDESWALLQKKLFHAESCPPPLRDLGMQIAANCKGLPLTIVIVAGLLATMEQEIWIEALQGLSSGIISSTEQCMNTMQLSYERLPDYLKACLLYLGAFPGDKEVSTKRLIQLWIAEGFVRKSESKSLEDIATDYMMELIGRSLIMVAQQRSMGGVKGCRVHDLIHDFCLAKAREENFFQLLIGSDELVAFNEPGNLRRLCIHSKPGHFQESKLYCPRVRSLLLFLQKTDWGERDWLHITFISHSFKLLKVLDLEEFNMGHLFPEEMGLLVHLRYLAVRGLMGFIPPSIGNLSNLETFIVHTLIRMVSLPDSLWKLQKLRHICMIMGPVIEWNRAGFCLPVENLDNSLDLHKLDSFSGAIFPSWLDMEKQMRKFPNIRKLKCRIMDDNEDTKGFLKTMDDKLGTNHCNWISEYCDDIENRKKIVVPHFLVRLEALDVSLLRLGAPRNDNEFEFCFPVNLKKLTLSLFGAPWSKISAVGRLPNLEVLKLLEKSFSGDQWEMEEGEFPKLRFFKLSSLDIVNWTASYDQFPYLKKLVLENCSLEEIPSCLEETSTLEMIEVSDCSGSTASLVEQIQEAQENMGNSALKIFIRNQKAFSTSSVAAE